MLSSTGRQGYCFADSPGRASLLLSEGRYGAQPARIGISGEISLEAVAASPKLRNLWANPRARALQSVRAPEPPRLLGDRSVLDCRNPEDDRTGFGPRISVSVQRANEITCVGVCFIGKVDVARAMVMAGLARDCLRFSDGRYRDAELTATTARANTGNVYRPPRYCLEH